MYSIEKGTLKKAEKLGVIVKPSKNKYNKIDIFAPDGNFLTSVGDVRYLDYYKYLKLNKQLAEERRNLYKERHQKDRLKKYSKGWFADQLLW
jgi:hypothetical protein